MTRRWFTADLHFGHRNIARYTGRPFPDTDAGVDEMNATLIKLWNGTVGEDDEVWVLGDVAMGRIKDTLERVGELHGRLHLVAGNHDRCWPVDPIPGMSTKHIRKAEEWVDRYREVGFETIAQDTRMTLHDGTEVRLNHFPYEGDSHDEDRFVSARPLDDGGWLLHGHIHQTARQRGHQINVGCDAWALSPVSEDQIVSLIAEGPQDREPLPYPDVSGV
jgi:calcineurin-like phosphoesterase family protein